MIALLFLILLFTVVYFGVRNPSMTEEDYELYFRTQVMGMTVSTLLSPEVLQLINAEVCRPLPAI